ncbi:hypothetical protein PHAVU_008G121900 [Phaseolus vulgaris]|uniref:Knottin scorpion toxin-like domain-containing protein n=1 Tax=Phaseolus vulgaris TaxID=3885 RepID=V7B3Y6_PHAVU|nr:hypothetical protein PHAVU_008G121900g [Phaseolus vulgaris]ESW12544.1 hypothetical protein PHAVU_008G121900g [Phaseolus vulgaris]
MASRFCQSFIFGVLVVALVLTSVPEAVTGFTDPGLNCHGPCTPHCNTDCTNQGSKKGFCLQQGSLNLCCCS